jgi:hypothetical protein
LDFQIYRGADMWKFIGVVAAAILLGMVSPFLAAADDGVILRAWLQWLPIQVDLLFLPGSEIAMLMLAMLVLSAQYMMIFFLVMPLQTLLRRLGKLLARPLSKGRFAY